MTADGPTDTATDPAALTLDSKDPRTKALRAAIRAGDIAALRAQLEEEPALASARISRGPDSRTVLHETVDWPGNFPGAAESIDVLVKAGADVNGRCTGRHPETPLMWAASCDDLEALDALVSAGADLELEGAVLGDGTALSDATGFKQWKVARRLVQHGAVVTPAQAASLGMRGQVRTALENGLDQRELDLALWYAAHGAQRECAEMLIAAGANPRWPSSWDQTTSIDAASGSDATELAEWLAAQPA